MQNKKLKKTYDILLIGHVSKDIIIVKGRITKTLGGAVYYSSIAAKRSGSNVLVITKLAHSDIDILKELDNEEIDYLPLGSTQTTSIENIYYTGDLDRRKVTLISQADSFKIEDIPEYKSYIYHLAGLFHGEIPDSLIEPLSTKGKIALDVQGILRRSENGKLLFRDWEKKYDLLPYVTFLKTDTAEAEIIAGTGDRRKAAKILYNMGAKEIMITHSSEVLLYDGQDIYSAPFTPSNLSGRTGRGDTCFASYLAYRLNHNIQQSLDYAAALTSIKMETPGPFRGTVKDVLSRIAGSAL
ncbi:MAG: carbohydrate kinase [Spirochaetales bacterium]|nr:carbohydrate kinase [Spirochaetales bacterium]